MYSMHGRSFPGGFVVSNRTSRCRISTGPSLLDPFMLAIIDKRTGPRRGRRRWQVLHDRGVPVRIVRGLSHARGIERGRSLRKLIRVCRSFGYCPMLAGFAEKRSVATVVGMIARSRGEGG